MRQKNVRELALQILIKVEQDGAYSNLVLNQTLSRRSLERTDAALLTELVYGTIQRQNTLDHYLNKWLKKGTKKLDLWVLILLRISLYQLLYLDRIPAHAIVDEAVKLAKRRGHRGISGMVNGVLRNMIRNQDELVLSDLDSAAYLALKHSHPKWLVSRWINQFGKEETEALCEANLEPPSVNLRVNRLKTNREEFIHHLKSAGFQADASQVAPDGIVVHKGGNLARTAWYEEGWFSIQDESSMLPAVWLAPEPGMKVLDACAAPGGKTTQLAEMMNDEGEIWANDIHKHKEQLIVDQAERLGLSSIRTSVYDARTLHQRFASESFDCVLLDAPCSGFGVIRRKPELKWRRRERELSEIAQIQYEILQSVASLVKPGGRLVYSTCTMEQVENEQNVERFLAANPEWQLDPAPPERIPASVIKRSRGQQGWLQILPHHFGSDGFFIARMKKS